MTDYARLARVEQDPERRHTFLVGAACALDVLEDDRFPAEQRMSLATSLLRNSYGGQPEDRKADDIRLPDDVRVADEIRPTVTDRIAGFGDGLLAFGAFAWFACVPAVTLGSFVLAAFGVDFLRELWGFDA